MVNSADTSTVDVVVAWARTGPARPDTERLLTTAVRALTGRTTVARHSHLCPRCGSDGHGKPFLVDHPELGISVAHTPGATAVACVRGTSVGVDLERASDPGARSVATVLLHPHEHAADDDDLARTWVRKESLVKALGTGLALDPRSIEVSSPRESPRVRRLPAPYDEVQVRMHDLVVAPSHVGCVSVLSSATPVVRLVEAAPAAPAS